MINEYIYILNIYFRFSSSEFSGIVSIPYPAVVGYSDIQILKTFPMKLL